MPGAAAYMTRLPAGHPEGFLEAFGTLYRDIAIQLHARKKNESSGTDSLLVPGIDDGLRGMQFIEKAVASNAAGNNWQKLD